jgi:hypothetical protein
MQRIDDGKHTRWTFFVVLFDDAEEVAKQWSVRPQQLTLLRTLGIRDKMHQIKCITINWGVKADPPFAVFMLWFLLYILGCNIYCIVAVKKDD